MEQKIIISNVSDIQQIAHEISMFNVQKRIIKVHLNQFTEAENRQLECEIVKQYAAGGQQVDGKTGICTLLVYLALVVTDIIPVFKWGAINTILLYVVLSLAGIMFIRMYRIWHARKSLNRLARELPAAPSFGYL